MAENSGIEWTHHTFNPWIGCTKVSPACDFCYAEEWNKRYEGGKNWGQHAPRRKTKTWGNPVRWNKDAAAKGIRYRVFCASLADVFDNHKSILPEWREELWSLIRETPNLDWLLLTKRPQNIKKMRPDDWGNGYPNVWIGTTVESQKEAEQRLPHLRGISAAVRFVSCEPLLGPLELRAVAIPQYGGSMNMLMDGIDWVIAGGESGANFRPGNPDWFRALRDQCVEWNVPFLFKQWEGSSQPAIKKLGRELDGVVWDQYPTAK